MGHRLSVPAAGDSRFAAAVSAVGLDRIYGQTGLAEAYTALRAQVMDVIARAVPELAAACAATI